MASQKSSSTNDVLMQLQQLQRITQQMPMFTTSSKSAAVTTNNVLQQLHQLQRITQQIIPSKTTSLSVNSNITPISSTPKSVAASTNNVHQMIASQNISSTTYFSATSSPTESVAATSNKVHQQPQQPRKQQEPGLSYILYLQLEEMRKPKSTKLSKAKAKYQLTHELISKTMRTVHKLSPADLEIISQQTIYKKNLQREIANEKHKKLMEDYQKKAKFPKKLQQKHFLPQPYRYHQPSGSVGSKPMESIPSSGYFSFRI